LGISGLSTGAYALFTNDKNNKQDKKEDYAYIFCIVLLISFMIVFLTSGNSESIVPVSRSANPLNTKVPF
jgi:hypothetical protein